MWYIFTCYETQLQKQNFFFCSHQSHKKVSQSYQISTALVPFELKFISFIHSEILIMEKFHFRLLLF